MNLHQALGLSTSSVGGKAHAIYVWLLSRPDCLPRLPLPGSNARQAQTEASIREASGKVGPKVTRTALLWPYRAAGREGEHSHVRHIAVADIQRSEPREALRNVDKAAVPHVAALAQVESLQGVPAPAVGRSAQAPMRPLIAS